MKNAKNAKEIKFDNKLLRQIATTSFGKSKLPDIAEKLEPGNAQIGIAADLINYCEINHIPASVYYAITSEYQYAIQDVQLFADISTKLLPQLDSKSVNTEDLKLSIKKYNKMKASNNIYL